LSVNARVRKDKVGVITLVLDIRNVAQLRAVMQKVGKVPEVYSVERVLHSGLLTGESTSSQQSIRDAPTAGAKSLRTPGWRAPAHAGRPPRRGQREGSRQVDGVLCRRCGPGVPGQPAPAGEGENPARVCVL